MSDRRYFALAGSALALAVAASPARAAGDAASASGSLNSPPAGAARSSAERGGTQDTPRPYSVVRWDEDYSYLKDPARRTDYLDPIKYIPFNQQGDWYASFGGQIRDRYEYFNHPNFGGGPQDRDGYNLFRFIPYVDLHFGPNVRVFAQFRTSLENGREGGPRGRDEDTADLQQGFIEFDLPLGDKANLSVKAGRQEMAFGKERLVGVADWNNAPRNYDGVRATINTPNNSLDLVWFRPVLVDKYHFDQDQNPTNFFAVYDTMKLTGVMERAKAKLSLYGFALDVAGTSKFPNITGAGSETRYTVGSEFTMNPGHWDLDVEGDYQFGDVNGESISAVSIATEGGYTFADVMFTPRPFLGFDLASGDHSPNNGHLGTFNQLFPTGHTYFGYMDFIGRQNIIDLHPGVEVTFIKNQAAARKLALRTEYHQFWRESSHDAMYDATGAVFRAAGTSGSSSIGSEVDLLMNWQFDRHLSGYVGYSHFFPGNFLHDTGPSREVDFAYAAVVYTF